MELALAYIESSRGFEPNPEPGALPLVVGRVDDGLWDTFLESEEHSISVYAGRRTGKTFKLAERAVQSEHDCIIFVRHHSSVFEMERIIRNIIGPEADTRVTRGTTESVISMANYRGIEIRSIEIRKMPRIRNEIQGRNLRNREVMFDEFDNDYFEGFIEYFSSSLEQAAHIVCVGSMVHNQNPGARRWFQFSEHRICIDSGSRTPYRFDVEHEMYPSRFI